MDSHPAIRSVALSKSFGDVTALRGVSFEVSYGEVFAYLGRNGSGKTTTVRILTGLSAQSGGDAWVGGRPLADLDRRAIGVTLQSAALDPAMTAREHLRFLAGLWGYRGSARTHVVEDHLDRFGLAEAADRLIRTYSGGMKRRLDLAGALLHQPAVLFLDEPTTGLDAQSRRGLWEKVRSLQREGTAILLTTQYLEEADELADRVAILDQGSIVAEGFPGELRNSLGGVELAITLIRGTAEPRAVALADGRIIPAASDGVVRIPVADSDEAIEALNYIRSVWPIQGARIESPTLEDVFLAVTSHTDSDVPAVLDSVA